jgi:pimeloyl-ACP methyl ester carboxylesterase
MDEASSKFVDRLVQEKLLEDKLSRVHHAPVGGIELDEPDLFDATAPVFGNDLPEIVETAGGFRFPSPLPCDHPENRECQVLVHRSPNGHGSIVLLHGLFEDSRGIYDFLVRGLLKLGLNVYQSTLPFHYDRQPASSLFSGEYFWSANYRRTRRGFEQAVRELDLLERILHEREGAAPLVCGFSMGGCVSMLLASMRHDLAGVMAINPPARLSGIVWDSPLCATIKADYRAAGYSMERLEPAFRAFEPYSRQHVSLSRNRVKLVYGVYDQVTSNDQYEDLVRAWNLDGSLAYKAGHLNTLRMPRLAGDIANFFQTVAAPTPETPRT